MTTIARVPLSSSQQFGKNVYKLRHEAGLTQEALAERADISRRHLQMIEAGRMNPSVEIVIKLKKGLKFPWDRLFQDC